MTLSRKKNNFKILSDKLKSLIDEEASTMTGGAVKSNESPVVEKEANKLIKQKYGRGRKKKESLIDGRKLLTCCAGGDASFFVQIDTVTSETRRFATPLLDSTLRQNIESPQPRLEAV
jgi:hypothetical protein